MTHAAEVALAFFAYVGGEEDGDGCGGCWRSGGAAAMARMGGEAGAVVADAGGVDAGGVVLFEGLDEGAGGKTVSRWAERRMQGGVAA